MAFDLNLISNGEPLKVYEQWSNVLRAVLCKGESGCAVEGQVGAERKTSYWTTDLMSASGNIANGEDGKGARHTGN